MQRRIIPTSAGDWLLYDELSSTVFGYEALEHAVRAWCPITPEVWRRLYEVANPYALLEKAREVTRAAVFALASELIDACLASGFVSVSRGRRRPWSLQAAAHAANPEAYLELDEDCAGGVSHRWLLAPTHTDARLFHVRLTYATVVPPDASIVSRGSA